MAVDAAASRGLRLPKKMRIVCDAKVTCPWQWVCRGHAQTTAGLTQMAAGEFSSMERSRAERQIAIPDDAALRRGRSTPDHSFDHGDQRLARSSKLIDSGTMLGLCQDSIERPGQRSVSIPERGAALPHFQVPLCHIVNYTSAKYQTCQSSKCEKENVDVGADLKPQTGAQSEEIRQLAGLERT